ncbi:toxin regulator [Evansella clarkii]|uniref:toxin regulator n=1 Tax=Evansella clarkii TaxID=79879 RepID=UPI000B42E0AA|nr:toxin regulator [Evansella clarkii]
MEWLKKTWKFLLTFMLAMVIGLSLGSSGESLDAKDLGEEKMKNDSLTEQLSSLETVKDDLEDNNKDLENKNKDLENINIDLENKNKDLEKKITDLEERIEEAAPWFQLSEEEKKQKEAEAEAAKEKRLADEQAKKEADEKAKAEEEEKAHKEAEEKEKMGYDTGITYDQLARTPDDYMYEKVKFSGKVIQVIEGEGETQIRFAVNDNYDTVLFAQYNASIVESRVLEDDKITIYGTSVGLITYETTLGANKSIPAVLIERIDQ